jgi:hypothetical protein
MSDRITVLNPGRRGVLVRGRGVVAPGEHELEDTPELRAVVDAGALVLVDAAGRKQVKRAQEGAESERAREAVETPPESEQPEHREVH